MESSDAEESIPPSYPALVSDASMGVTDEHRYRLLQPIGKFGFHYVPVYKAAITHSAGPVYDNMTSEEVFVAIKCVHIFRNVTEYNELRIQVVLNRLVAGHENLVEIQRPFYHQSHYCVVFPYMGMGSIRHILRTKFPDGMPEDCILLVLRETLVALDWIHKHQSTHDEINAGNILLNRKPEIKLSFKASVYATNEGFDFPSPSSILPINLMNNWGTAPEVYYRLRRRFRHPIKGDIWMIGLTALELACGGIPVPDRASLERLAKKIRRSRKLPTEGEENKRKEKKGRKKYLIAGARRQRPPLHVVMKQNLSDEFQEMVSWCLERRPAVRPTAEDLLKEEIFTNLNTTVSDFYNLVCVTPAIDQ